MGTYDSESAQIKRQRMIADALRQSGNESIQYAPPTGNRAYKHSEWEGVNKILQNVLGAYLGTRADKQQASLDEKDKTQLAEVVNAKRFADAQGNQAPDASNNNDLTEAPLLPNVNGKARLQAAALRGQEFGGSAGDVGGEILKRELFPPVKQPYTLGADDVRFDENNTPVASGLPRTVRESPEDRALIKIDAKTFPGATDADKKAGYVSIKRSEFAPGMREWEKPTGGAGTNGQLPNTLDADTIRNAAQDVIRGGPQAIFQYVSRSAQDKPTRDAINNMATKLARDAGMSNDAVARFRARVQGELKSQKDLVGMKNAVESYEKLAKFNGERLLQLVEGVDTTGVPALEGALRYTKSKGGNVDAAEFQSVLKTYQTEVARIISQPKLVGQLTDTQIDEMKKVVDGSASAPQLRRVVNRLNLEMDMRADALAKQVENSGNALTIPGGEPAAAPAAAPAAVADPNDHSSLWK